MMSGSPIRQDSANGPACYQHAACRPEDHRPELAFLLDLVCMRSEVDDFSFDILLPQLQAVDPSLRLISCLLPTHKRSSQPASRPLVTLSIP